VVCDCLNLALRHSYEYAGRLVRAQGLCGITGTVPRTWFLSLLLSGPSFCTSARRQRTPIIPFPDRTVFVLAPCCEKNENTQSEGKNRYIKKAARESSIRFPVCRGKVSADDGAREALVRDGGMFSKSEGVISSRRI
jgi:hypothetical protein